MGDYIFVSKDQPSHPGIYDMVDAILDDRLIELHARTKNGLELMPVAVQRGILRNVVAGALVTLWSYADRRITGDNKLHLSLAGVAHVMELPVEWVRLLPKKWLLVCDDGSIELPNYCERNHLIPYGDRVQTKADARSRKYRNRLRRNNVSRDVTKTSQSRDRTSTSTSTNQPVLVQEPASPGASFRGRAGARRGFEKEFQERFGTPPKAEAKEEE